MSKILGPKVLEYRLRPAFLKDLVWPDARNIKVIQDVEEINRILDYMASQTRIIYAKRGADANLAHNSYIYVDNKKVILTVLGYDGCCRKREYGFWLDERVESMLTGTEVWKEMNRVYFVKPLSKIAETEEEEEIIGKFTKRIRKQNEMKHLCAAIPYTYTKFMRGGKPVKKRVAKVWCYDMNSCYGAVLRNKIPDFEHPMYNHIVRENEIGFLPEEGCTLVHEGEFAYIAFPLMDSPFRSWVDEIYELKKNSPKGSYEKEDAKARLVRGIGNYEHSNMLMRAYIVNTANEIIQSLMDKNTIFCNTDCIHSTVERNDLLTGEGIGQFKLEYSGDVGYSGHSYQFGHGIPKVPSASKRKFKRGWDIVTDKLPPEQHTKYYLDYLETKIKERKQCIISRKTQSQDKPFVVRTTPLREVILRLSMRGIHV